MGPGAPSSLSSAPPVMPGIVWSQIIVLPLSTTVTRRTWPADPAINESYESSGLPRQNAEFAHLDSRIRDIVPQAQPLGMRENPFATAYATRTSQMHFNFPSYGQLLLDEFFGRGGRFGGPRGICALRHARRRLDPREQSRLRFRHASDAVPV